MRRSLLKLLCPLLFLVLLPAWTSLPKGLTAVNNFQIDRYLCNEYEIASRDHFFERYLRDVYA